MLFLLLVILSAITDIPIFYCHHYRWFCYYKSYYNSLYHNCCIGRSCSFFSFLSFRFSITFITFTATLSSSHLHTSSYKGISLPPTEYYNSDWLWSEACKWNCSQSHELIVPLCKCLCSIHSDDETQPSEHYVTEPIFCMLTVFCFSYVEYRQVKKAIKIR